MDRTLRKYLTDISASIAEIESFLNQRPKMFETFVMIACFGEQLSEILK